MKAFLTFLLLASVSVASGGGTDGFVTVPVEKTVGDFELRIDRSSPLGLYLSTEYIAATGKQSLWLQLHSYQFRHNAAGEDIAVSVEAAPGKS